LTTQPVSYRRKSTVGIAPAGKPSGRFAFHLSFLEWIKAKVIQGFTQALNTANLDKRIANLEWRMKK
jgi:hypothetical protein